MTITPLDRTPDVADAPPDESLAGGVAGQFSAAVRSAGEVFERAGRSEHAFAAHAGGLLPMVLDRAQADVVLSVAAAAASRGAQAITTIFNMSV